VPFNKDGILDQQLFWNSENWQPLCKVCHDIKTASEDGAFGNKKEPLPNWLQKHLENITSI
jgi:5-methylcytosine-specific restriction endonuclease McrA